MSEEINKTPVAVEVQGPEKLDKCTVRIKGDKEVTMPRYCKVERGGVLEYLRIKGRISCWLIPGTAAFGTATLKTLTAYEAEHAVPVTREEWVTQVAAALRKQYDLLIL